MPARTFSSLSFALVVVLATRVLAQTQPPSEPVGQPPLVAPSEPAAPAAPAAAAPATPPAQQTQAPADVPAPAPAEPPPPAAPITPVLRDTAPAPASPSEARLAGASYTPGRGFTLRTEDGDYSLRVGARLQFMYELLAPVLDGDRHSLELRRARLRFSGNAFGPDVLYLLHLGFAPYDLERGPVTVSDTPSDSDVLQNGPVLDATLELAYLRDLHVTVGQRKVPWSRQRITSGAELLTVERPLADQTFNLGRDVGVDLHSEDLLGAGLVRYHAGIFAGEGPNPSTRTIGAGDRGFLYNFRFEVLPVGLFTTDSELDIARGEPPRVKLGLAYALLQADATSPLAGRYLQAPLGGAESPALVDFNAHNVTADALLLWQGLSAFLTFHWRSIDGLAGGRDGRGMTLGAGYLLKGAPLVIGATYSGVRSPAQSVLEQGDEVMATVAYLVHENFLKLHLDYSRLWGEAGFSDGTHRLRLQLQALL